MQNTEVRTPIGHVRGARDKQHMTLKMLLDSQSKAVDSLARAVDSLSGALDSQLRAPDRFFNRQQKNELLQHFSMPRAPRHCIREIWSHKANPAATIPSSVLWTLQDYRREQAGSNPRGNYPPKMRLAIRDEDGRSSNRLITPTTAVIPECKTFYKTNHPDECSAVIGELEDACPLLTLCNSHWKAEGLLGSVMKYMRSKAACQQEWARRGRGPFKCEGFHATARLPKTLARELPALLRTGTRGLHVGPDNTKAPTMNIPDLSCQSCQSRTCIVTSLLTSTPSILSTAPATLSILFVRITMLVISPGSSSIRVRCAAVSGGFTPAPPFVDDHHSDVLQTI
ncbi:hypothetical protein H4582DRAFT_2060647 [Lactarius indigo]|nr:hypothetical protein H4582DRAFT_2060647 [Lactarius indigo]